MWFDRPVTSAAESLVMHRTARIIPSTTAKRDVLERFTINVEYPDGTSGSFEASAHEYILDAARRAGLELPSLCERGWCLTCAALVLEGEVDQSDSLRYYEEDREAGFALLCTGKPRSNLRLLACQTAAMRQHRDSCGLPSPRGTG